MEQQTKTDFTKEQFEAIYPDGIENHYWTKFRNSIVAKFTKKYHTTGKILEVGCGRGVVINYLVDQGIEACGVELAEVSPLTAVKDRIWANCDAKDLPKDYRDQVETILLLDVIEHLQEPESFLQQLKEQYKRLKTVVITVPARKELFSNYDEFNGHFRRYDLDMLKHTATNIQAKIIYQTYLYRMLYLPAKLTLSFSGKRTTHIEPPKGRVAIALHALIAKCLHLDYLIFPKKWKGTSIISVIQFDSLC
ncbi:MAG: class I SAM-dependent methyltransferase [Bacteroidales bacterium]|nr:class I SAM-dependent methyltransferase [Bacteroidales bacterium]